MFDYGTFDDLVFDEEQQGAVVAARAAGWIPRRHGKRWWDELLEEFEEKQRLERESQRPSQAKRAVEARNEVTELAEEALKEGLFSRVTAKPVAVLVAKTRQAPKLADTLVYAKQAQAHIDTLRKSAIEDDEEDLVMALAISEEF